MKPVARLFPAMLIVVGVALLLSKQGVITLPSLHTWWPLLLVAAGVRWLLWPRSSRTCQASDTPLR